MISSVRGTVLSAMGSGVVIEVGGVGLAVQTTTDAVLSLRVGEQATLHTALVVREDELALFGFPTPEELDVFDLLRGVSGVGPKSALGVLSALRPAEIARAVAEEDDAAFRRVSGIGPKTAKLIVISLAGKVHAPAAASAPAASASVSDGIHDSVVSALVGLGWPERVGAQVVAEVVAESDDREVATAQTVLRLALARLGPGART